ncbi:hypothetical protein MHYP_G00179450 [Metynnis hypsauchen]
MNSIPFEVLIKHLLRTQWEAMISSPADDERWIVSRGEERLAYANFWASGSAPWKEVLDPESNSMKGLGLANYEPEWGGILNADRTAAARGHTQDISQLAALWMQKEITVNRLFSEVSHPNGAETSGRLPLSH